MGDHNENTIIYEEKDEFPAEFDEMITHAVSYELAKRLCEDIEVTDEYRKQLVQDLANDFSSALREFRKTHGYTKPIRYPRREKMLINRMFRYKGEGFIPFPEVDTPYERFRACFLRKRKITLRFVREERRPIK